MAKFLYFPMTGKKESVSGGERSYFGYARMTERAAKFLDIDQKGSRSPDLLVGKGQRDAHTRKHPTTGSSIQVPKSDTIRGFDAGNFGAKSVQLTSLNKSFSVRLPSWATLLDIADLFGTLIPTAKFGNGTNEIEPYFKSPGGRRYPIASKEAAQALTDSRSGDEIAKLDRLNNLGKSKEDIRRWAAIKT